MSDRPIPAASGRRRKLGWLLLALVLASAAVLWLIVSHRTPQVLTELEARNPETAEYVQEYHKYKRRHFEIDLSEDVTPGTVPLFLQWDRRWGYETYGETGVEDMIGLSGCGPTALSMVTVALTGDLRWHPLAVAQYSEQNGHYTPGYGTAWTLMSVGSEAMGLSCREVPLHEDSMVMALEDGELMIASVGPGSFTEKGHFIVLCGWNGTTFEVRDPNSRSNTEKRWPYDTLESQIRGLWAFQAADGSGS